MRIGKIPISSIVAAQILMFLACSYVTAQEASPKIVHLFTHGNTEYIDLDGSGVRSKINFVEVESNTDFGIIQDSWVNVNNIPLPPVGMCYPEPFLVDIDSTDKYKEIMINVSWQQYSKTCFYYYNGKSIEYMGDITSVPEGGIDGSGIIRAHTPAVGFYGMDINVHYRLNKEHKLELVHQELYIPSAVKYYVKLLKDLSLQKSPKNNSIVMVLRPREPLCVVGTDNVRWFLLENAKGQQGWLDVNKWKYGGGDKYFENYYNPE